MQSRREFLGVLPASLLGSGYATTLVAASMKNEGPSSITISPEQQVYRPLDEVTVQGAGRYRLLVLDGEGRSYVDRIITLPAPFHVGGALGTHTVLLLNEHGALLNHVCFMADARTEIR